MYVNKKYKSKIMHENGKLQTATSYAVNNLIHFQIFHFDEGKITLNQN